MKKKHLLWFLITWVLLVTSSFVWNYVMVAESNEKLVLNKARAFFDHLVTTREWNAEHGGVYVPVTPSSQPNSYLKDSLRDIITDDGRMYTKINPAYMTRQLSEINNKELDVVFHITSLNPIRPANKADEWETEALKSFTKSTDYVLAPTESEPIQYRFMAPLITQKSCLQCHAEQGYTLGSIRGGISVSFPGGIFLKSIRRQLLSLGVIHFIILALGIGGLILYFRMSNRFLGIIQAKNDELEKANSTKDKFFSIIAHDLRSPLSALIAFGQVLQERHKVIEAESREKLIHSINEGSRKTFNLLNNLLQWARSEAGQLENKPDTFLLHKLITQNISLFTEKIEQKRLSVNNFAEPGLLAYADKNMLNTVLRNLLSNAIRFTPAKGTITIRARHLSGDLIKVSIHDTGIGIDPDALATLFDKHTIYTRPGTENESGTGLGLKLCKEFVEKNGGTIQVQSEPGKGSSFSFTLPSSKI